MVEEFKENTEELTAEVPATPQLSKLEEILEKQQEEEKLLDLMVRRLDMKEDSKTYDYEEMKELLRKFIIGVKSPLDIINEDEIFDLFLIKFKKDILGDKIDFNIHTSPAENH